MFCDAQAAGTAERLTVISYQPEPGCHRVVATTPLTPDAYVELGLRARGLKFAYWLEIDRDTENSETLKGKCVRYWRAYQAWDGDTFPYIVFVVPDMSRCREIERVIASAPDEAQALFQVYLLDDFAEVIHRNMQLTEVKALTNRGNRRIMKESGNKASKQFPVREYKSRALIAPELQ